MTSDVNINTVLGQQQNTSNSSAQLATDFSEFLTLLTIQLQNQDPLSPMDTTEFTNQLVAFSGVEQQINTNQKLDSLVSLALGDSFSVAQSYVGLNVSYLSSEFTFDGQSPAKITYALDGDAITSKINIRDESGDVIYTADSAKSGGPHEFFWNGQMSGGGTAPEGTYTVTIDALDANDGAVTGTTVVEGLVRGVETQNGQLFVLVGDRAVPVSSILNTSSPDISVGGAENLTFALEYVGMDITYLSTATQYNGSDDTAIQYELERDAVRAKIFIFDEDGNRVFTDDAPFSEGSNTYMWDGRLDNGTIADPDTTYQFVIDAIDAEDERVNASSFASGRVTGVETFGGNIFLVTDLEVVPLSNVRSVNQPPLDDPEPGA